VKYGSFETTLELEVRIAQHFNFVQNIIVPNVNWGLFHHECDLTILTKSGYAYEIEIKVSKADLLKDKKKHHQHRDRKIKYLYFAIPAKLEKYSSEIPLHAGILVVDKEGHVHEARKPIANMPLYVFTPAEFFQLARLGTMRVWGLKEKLLKRQLYELLRSGLPEFAKPKLKHLEYQI